MTSIIADKPGIVSEDPGEAIVYDQRGQLWFQEAVFYEVNINMTQNMFSCLLMQKIGSCNYSTESFPCSKKV